MRFKRIKIKDHKFQIRTMFFEDHHLTASERGGQSVNSNLLYLEAYRHTAIHYLFDNMTLCEIIDYLKSLDFISDMYEKEYSENAVYLLFGYMSLDEIIICLMRLRALKTFEIFKMRLN